MRSHLGVPDGCGHPEADGYQGISWSGNVFKNRLNGSYTLACIFSIMLTLKSSFPSSSFFCSNVRPDRSGRRNAMISCSACRNAQASLVSWSALANSHLVRLSNRASSFMLRRETALVVDGSA